MRPNNEIQADAIAIPQFGNNNYQASRLIIELLLDIRDCLQSLEESIDSLANLTDRRTR